ncbi:phospholipase D-like domain-containing protein [Profundibacterium mesophilum]|uniref:Phospholipase D n=1 Tax=Profundibacterium mesophilum KAUST100406-0324 TaxID=1037889 RepID=A0A921NSF0_9RHOB|nr:phospholipase D-like domain-containing protein [Profundibacterium mesophilum]KAF0677120.1 Cardiolipin synthetase [Profundibacterium mesophilum KAUST100406-0324]
MMQALPSLHVAVGMVLSMITLVVILQQRRSPQSTAAWVLFVIVLPYAAIPLFLLLGFRKRGSRFSAIAYREADETIEPVHEVGHVLRDLGIPGATRHNALTLLTGNAEAEAALFDLVRSARERIDATFYLIRNDPSGESFVDLLTERAEAGIEVRLILDRLGSLSRPKAALRRFAEAGGTLTYFSPLIQPPDKGHLNLRNHRKLVIADLNRVWSGGRNIGDEYFGVGPGAWQDLSFTVSGPVVQTYIDVFSSDWNVTAKGSALMPPIDVPDRDATAIVQLVPSGPDAPNDPLHDGLVNAIHRAEKRVWITTPYFLPTEALLHALHTAAHRKIDLRIVMPRRSNQWTADFARGAYVRDLEIAGARIFRHEGMIHGKAGIIDDFGWLGSANFDVRSMLLNFETTLFIYDHASLEAMTEWMLRLQDEAREGLRPAGFTRRLAEGIFRLGAPIL